ncbi:MAG: type II secretion system protein [Candidatus Doudnabacteria bacterium]
MKNLSSKLKRAEGFTLIELLVVVSIIGLLASIIVVALSNVRLKSRDARRLADMQQIKTGLDIYYNLGSGYPDPADWNAAQAVQGQLSCSGSPTLTVPQDPLHNGTPAYAYTYSQGGNISTGCGGNVSADYEIQFQTEGATDLGPAGTYWLSGSAGITTSAPF